jgi:RHS repeat-associated protein
VLTPGLAQRSGSTDRFSHADWIGSARYLTDSTGNAAPSALRYDAYGCRTALAGPAFPTEFEFVGKLGYESEYQDGSDAGLGIDYLQARYYDPVAGRFISRDPIGFATGINEFVYTNNNPACRVDPSGLLTLPNDPTGLGPDWQQDQQHGGSEKPRIQRWYHKNDQDGLEWNAGRPGQKGIQARNHWHRLIKNPKGRWERLDPKEHLEVGEQIPDPVATSRWEPAIKEDFSPYLLALPAPKFLQAAGWLREFPAAVRAAWEFIWRTPAVAY